MIRLLSAGLGKVWHSRFFLLAFSVLLGANLFLLWFGTGHTPGNVPSAAYRKLEQQISGMSMEDIGSEFGGRDHSTVFYATSQVVKNMKQDTKYKETVEDIIKNIRDS